jgi:acetyl-CoA acetyltransferase
MSVRIAGVGAVECRRWHGERSAHELALDAIRSALADAGIAARDVDGLYTTQIGWFAIQEKFLAQRMAETLAISTRAQLEAECGGASSLVALRVAAADVSSGRVDVALVWAADVEIPVKLFDPSRHVHLIEQARSFYGPYVRPYGVVGAVPLYAMSAQAYMHTHGVTPEQAAAVSVLLRSHAKDNPLAYLRDPITAGDVLGSRIVSPPLHFLECAPWADGAAAVVLVNESRVGERGVRIRSFGEAHDPSSFAPLEGPIERFPNAGRAAADAYERAGVSPGDLDVAEVYGPFSVEELQLYEELGFAGPGEAARLVIDGITTYGGDLVVNPSGGRLSFGHPPYATPLYETVEIVTQLRGEAGPRQVDGARLGLVHAEHGMVNGSLVVILETA